MPIGPLLADLTSFGPLAVLAKELHLLGPLARLELPPSVPLPTPRGLLSKLLGGQPP